MIIQYTTFNSNKEFVEWQEANGFHIISVSPFVGGLNISGSEDDDKNIDVGGKTDIQVFVTFADPMTMMEKSDAN